MSSIELLDQSNGRGLEPQFQSEAALAEVEPRLAAIEQLARTYATPLYDALYAEYGRWRCGGASTLLIQLLAEDTGIPIVPFNRDRRQECFKLEMWMFNPNDHPELPPRAEHTNGLYNSGRGFSMTIDPTYRLHWRGKQPGPDAMLVEGHYDHQRVGDMHMFHLTPMSTVLVPRHTASYGLPQRGYPLWSDEKLDGINQARDILAVLQSPQVFDDIVETPYGDVVDVSDFWGSRLKGVLDVIRAQIPAGTLSLEHPTLD